MSKNFREEGARLQPTQMKAELFCIHSYAGESGPPCGWRGRAHEAVHDTKGGALRCPRCGRSTLLEIPPTETGNAPRAAGG